jgi:hypothetical protein
VIVRIATEGQYELPDDAYDELNRLDNETVASVENHDEPNFRRTYEALLQYVRDNGTELAGDDLHESAIILPPPDLTLAEAEADFTGDGLLPD